MKHISVMLTLAASIFPIGCQSNQPLPREIIILPDLSASIDKESQQQMFAAIKDTALHLHRGDSLTIIPITGDAEAELQGQILRYEVPPIDKREAYDGDLRKLSAQIANDLSRLSAEAAAIPGAHTDILGSVSVALRTFSDQPTDKRLVILSDFIQDDDQFQFTKDRRLESRRSATALAYVIRKEITVPTYVKVVMGRLRSSEFDRMALERRMSIETFWQHMFRPALISPDGSFDLRRTFSNT